MKKLGLKCKLITPLFMFGGDGNKPELRPSEFKGMMRWWWRAIKAENDITKLRKEEGEIFGGTGKGEGRSKVRIIIDTKLSSNADTFSYQPLPHHKRNNCPIDMRTTCKKAFRLQAFKDDKEIEIKFIIFDSNKDTQNIENLIYLMFILGGFGKRSRRGFGSFEIIEPKINVTLENILKLLNSINDSYEISEDEDLKGLKVIKHKNFRKMEAPYPWIKKIIIGTKIYPDYKSLLSKIGEASHKYRDPSLGSSYPRMASPVYVSAIRNGNGLKPIITVLNAHFPQNYPNYNLRKQIQFIQEITRE